MQSDIIADDDVVCLRGIVSQSACQIHLNEQHSPTSPLRIMLRASCSRFDANTSFGSVDVQLKYSHVTDIDDNMFWRDYSFPKIKVC
jgi:hypothetical protein